MTPDPFAVFDPALDLELKREIDVPPTSSGGPGPNPNC